MDQARLLCVGAREYQLAVLRTGTEGCSEHAANRPKVSGEPQLTEQLILVQNLSGKLSSGRQQADCNR